MGMLHLYMVRIVMLQYLSLRKAFLRKTKFAKKGNPYIGAAILDTFLRKEKETLPYSLFLLRNEGMLLPECTERDSTSDIREDGVPSINLETNTSNQPNQEATNGMHQLTRDPSLEWRESSSTNPISENSRSSTLDIRNLLANEQAPRNLPESGNE